MKDPRKKCPDCGKKIGPLEWSYHYQHECKPNNKPTMENWEKEFRLGMARILGSDGKFAMNKMVRLFSKLLAKHSQTKVEEESYTPEQIIQAYSIVLSKHGKMFMDELILELKRNFKDELKNTGGKKE